MFFTSRDGFSTPDEYSEDVHLLYWHDGKTGMLYNVHATQTEDARYKPPAWVRAGTSVYAPGLRAPADLRQTAGRAIRSVIWPENADAFA